MYRLFISDCLTADRLKPRIALTKGQAGNKHERHRVRRHLIQWIHTRVIMIQDEVLKKP